MQDSPRLYIAAVGQPWQAGRELALDVGQARYLGTVLRLGAGAGIRVFNAADGEWRAELAGVRKDRGTIRLVEQLRIADAVAGPTLLFAPLKRDATDLVVRMGTELGVSCFMPVVTERTNTHRINAERFRAIAIEAAEQCERLDVPAIGELRPLTEVLTHWPEGRTLFAALERRPGDDSAEPRPGDALLIGPEGGFSDVEARFLRDLPFIRAVSLGNLILRADTAVAAGLAQLAFRAQRGI